MIPHRSSVPDLGGAPVAYQFDFDPVGRIARGRMEGRITDKEFQDYYREAREFAALLQPRAGILDLSQVTSFDVSCHVISVLAEKPPLLPDRSWLNVVIAPSPAVFGVARMFQLRGEETRPNLHVVHTHAEAWEILGVEKEPQFAPVTK